MGRLESVRLAGVVVAVGARGAAWGAFCGRLDPEHPDGHWVPPPAHTDIPGPAMMGPPNPPERLGCRVAGFPPGATELFGYVCFLGLVTPNEVLQ